MVVQTELIHFVIFFTIPFSSFSDMASDDSDDEVRVADILDSMNEEMAVVMGGLESDAVCSFTKGYMKRQAVYACRTCLNISTSLAGFCYQCSVNCHAEHDVVELYTKRNFRCDCGNAKFNGFRCILWEEKDDENVGNQYNSNFSNKYCTCKRPYPDEDYEGCEEMIQCGICEDWFHVEHLNMGNQFVKPEEYEEMTCFQCARKHAFLLLYGMYAKEQPLTNMINGALSECQNGNNDILCINESDAKRSRLESTSDLLSSSACRLSSLISDLNLNIRDTYQIQTSDLHLIDESKTPSIFWSEGWRDRLCCCSKCKVSCIIVSFIESIFAFDCQLYVPHCITE
ncbi:unnamed protein product [Echinostoma caproni]|uniref:UBR-type domain-containing protein n=1 Tax=Echinostoma caproni TaxID=27848 RepID=A0A183BFW0_9TREM|nr:unnamed protein product [Echinostoma caproni]